MKKKKTVFRPADGILAGVVLLAALIWLGILHGRPAGKTVQVTVEGSVVATLPLDRDVELAIPGITDGQNTLVIRDGKARIAQADCPDKICVGHPAIFRAGESIICLPHRVVVTVLGPEAEVDATV